MEKKITKKYIGKECKKCGSSEKYNSTGGCVQCAKSSAMEYQSRYPQKTKKRKGLYYKNNKERIKDTKLLLSYNITTQEFRSMELDQNGVCKICERKCVSGRELSVDHDHESGDVRGLLCVNCNRAIGNLQDDPELLIKAAKYLKKEL